MVITLEDGRKIEMAILGVFHGQVRLGWAAPKTIVIDREEIHQRRKAESR
jgi:carbon storage regulator CsrA